MEPNQSSSHGDGATLLRETSCPLKVTEDIWFACCSCTYVTRDQHGIVSHLAPMAMNNPSASILPCLALGPKCLATLKSTRVKRHLMQALPRRVCL
uniref:Putative c2h2-type zn-finger protein n=1 Tax=Ixodes ricinus TaxID=34613 RepID=A0A0K8RED4_IXORI